MVKMYAKIVDEKQKLCDVGDGTNVSFYQSIGMSEMDVEEGYDGKWYLEGYAPVHPISTNEEQQAKRAQAYQIEVDPITAHIQRLLTDGETDKEKIAVLLKERADKVQGIKERYPYPEETEEAVD